MKTNTYTSIVSLLPKGSLITEKQKDWYMIQFDSATKIYVGRNQQGNQTILDKCIPLIDKTKVYYWFHLDGNTSAHTILEYNLHDTTSTNFYNAIYWIYKCIYNSLTNTIYCRLEDIKTTKTLGLVEYKNVSYCSTIQWDKVNSLQYKI